MASKQLNINPFSITSYQGADYFCDRVEESKNILNALQNGRNITLISPRKMGKTGLIKHVFAQNKDKGGFFFYIDIYDTTDLASFTKAFAESVFTQQISPLKSRVWKEISNLFASLRPVITTDPLTGMPQCQVEIKPQTEITTLQQIFAYLEEAKQPCYVAFDEFQVVADYTDCQMEAVLRKYIQHLKNVHFIFAGSKQHTMAEMFLAANRPFYQSTQIMYIETIAEQAYYEFAMRHLSKHRQHIAESVFHELYTMVEGHTWYVQNLLNRLYQYGCKEITYDNIVEVLNTILSENTPAYQTYSRLITQRQRELLRAVAREKTIKGITGKDFIQKHNLGSISTVQSAAESLVEKELLYEDNGTYSVYDRFYSLWLAM